MKNSLIICNPNSGRVKNLNFKSKCLEILKCNGYQSNFVCSEYKGHAEKLVSEVKNVDLIISIGGDGTFSEIVSGNAKRNNPILISHIPAGTANDIGAMYGYSLNIVNDLEKILNGEIKNVDLGTINGIPFTYTVGFGKFLDVPYITSAEVKEKYGYLAYLIMALKKFKERIPNYRISYINNGKIFDLECSFFLVTNSSKIAGTNGFYRNVLLDDGKFEVIMAKINNRFDMISKLFSLVAKHGENNSNFNFLRTEEMKIFFHDDNIPTWCKDGEILDNIKNPVVISSKKKMKILLPRQNLGNLFLK